MIAKMQYPLRQRQVLIIVFTVYFSYSQIQQTDITDIEKSKYYIDSTFSPLILKTYANNSIYFLYFGAH